MTEYPFKTTGTITYNPERELAAAKNDWWCTIELDETELTEYYRWWVNREWYNADTRTMKRRYHKSSHPPHVSIIRGEKPLDNIEDWGIYKVDCPVEFSYSNEIRQTSSAVYADEPDKFWFIEVKWDGYSDMRKHFGLDWERNGRPFRGHITVARTYD